MPHAIYASALDFRTAFDWGGHSEIKALDPFQAALLMEAPGGLPAALDGGVVPIPLLMTCKAHLNTLANDKAPPAARKHAADFLDRYEEGGFELFRTARNRLFERTA